MKRTFRQWAGALALGLCTLGGALLSTSAMAAPLTTVTQGGVTCGEYTRGAGFPDTYWDCITPATGGSTQPEWVVATTANALPATLKAGLSGVNTQIFVFANSANYTAFTGAASAATLMGDITSMNVKGAPAKVAAIFSTATIGGTVTNLTPYYKGIARFQLGRVHSTYVVASPLKPTDPFFTAAHNDDALYLSNKTTITQAVYPSSAVVWGATIAAAYPGKSPWEILGLRYGNGRDYVYGMQWSEQTAGTSLPPELHTVLNGFMQTTKVWTAQQHFGVTVQPWAANGGVLCVQTGNIAPWPHNWWSCVRPYSPSANISNVFSSPQSRLPPPVGVNPNWRTLLDTAGVKLYAFRDIAYYEDFFGIVSPTTVGVNGISKYTAPVQSSVFQDRYEDVALTIRVDTSPNTSGTIMHELGHQMDKAVWNHISTVNTVGVAGSVRFRNAVNLDKAAFNAAGTCAQVIDADRALATLPAICGLPIYQLPGGPVGATIPNWDIMTHSLYKYFDTDANPAHVAEIYEELWARAFARRAGGTYPVYTTLVQNRMPNQQTYMNDLWSTGAPHN